MEARIWPLDKTERRGEMKKLVIIPIIMFVFYANSSAQTVFCGGSGHLMA